jgi:DMSO/TMAO reductase YedYZ molybdopterin-dependent catalytic subunit
MNGRELPLAHGAPLRLRVETQLGYKSLKFLERIVVKDEFDDLGKIGDLQNGWAWYVGIRGARISEGPLSGRYVEN